MRNLIHNANLLDQQVSDYKIDSTFETASGTTNVEIRKSSGISKQILIVAAIAALVLLFAFLFFGR